MVETLNKPAVEKLLKQKNQRAISICIPTHRQSNSQAVNADKIEFKNALKEVRHQLADMGVEESERQKQLKEATTLVEDMEFWQHQDNSLCCYINDDGAVTTIGLPIEVESYAQVDNSYFLLPLIAAMHDNRRYHVLLLDQEVPLLLSGDMFNLEHNQHVDMPGPLEEALRIDEYQADIQYNPFRGSHGGAYFHGHGSNEDDDENKLRNYMRLVDNALSPLRKERLPLVLVGEESTLKAFMEVSHYSNIHPEQLHADLGDATLRDIHEQSWALIAEQNEPERLEARQQLERTMAISADKVAITTEALQKHASEGRVGTVLLNLARQTHDSVRGGMKEILKYSWSIPAETLKSVNQAVIEAWRHGAEVLMYTDNPSTTQPAVGLLRY